MELIKVNSQKLKIILTPDDMRELDITNESLDYGTPQTRRVFKYLLEKARDETGFNVNDDSLYIQIFPSTDGGCEMFLSKKSRLLPEPEQYGTYLKKKYTLPYDNINESRSFIAQSSNLENIIKLCARMKENGFAGKSSLYIYKQEYYLIIRFAKRYPSFSKELKCMDEDCDFSFMSEYADIYYANELPLLYISEHAKPLLKEKAVELFADKFK